MAQPVRFTKNRLHVGYRARDWEEVFYKSQATEDLDDDGPVLTGGARGKANKKKKKKPSHNDCFFTSNEAGEIWEAPKSGEILWLPFYDPAHFEAKDSSTKLDLQMEFLNHAYDYVAEQKPAQAQAMEGDLKYRNFARWNTWFQQAKKYKRKQLRERRYRVDRNKNKLRANGLSEKDIDDSILSDSTDDSAYDSDWEDRAGTQHRGRHPMGPPAHPSTAGQKRKMANGSRPGDAKHPRSSMEGFDGSRVSSLSMSGVRGESHDDASSGIFDTRPPQDESPAIIDGREHPTPSPTGSRNRPGVGTGANGTRGSDAFITDETPEASRVGTGFFVNSTGHDGRATPKGSWQSIAHHNGELTEEEGLEEAMRRRMQRDDGDRRDSVVRSIARDEEGSNGRVDDDEGIEDDHENDGEEVDGVRE